MRSECPAARADPLFRRVEIALQPQLSKAGKPPRSAKDHGIRINESDLPAGVSVEYWV